MKSLIADARRAAGLTQAEVAKKLHISLRLYQGIEYGSQPTPEQALQLSRILNAPGLTMVYCRRECAIGKAYCYELLNNVDLSALAILTKYRQEAAEANEALDKLSEIMLNKKNAQDCSEEELRELWRWAKEMLDLEHVIETLKLRLWDFVDVAALVEEHNQKCLDKNYVCTKKPALVRAG